MTFFSRACTHIVFLLLLVVGCTSSGGPPAGAAPTPEPAPLPVASSRPVTSDGLRIRLVAYAHDSMEGREAGTAGNFRATTYIANEARKIGLTPGGEDGTFFQTVPVRKRVPVSTLTAGGETFEIGPDVLMLPPIQRVPVATIGNVEGRVAVFGGVMGSANEISAQLARGKVVVLAAQNGQFNIPFQSMGKFREAAAIVLVNLDVAPADLRGFLEEPTTYVVGSDPAPVIPLTAFASDRLGDALFAAPLSTVVPGTESGPLQGTFGFRNEDPDAEVRNVVAILPGGDPTLRDEYVAIGAHSDHVGVQEESADHDSLRAYLEVVRPKGADSDEREANEEESARIAEILSDLRGTNRGPRPDSISNGADDDGSGTVTVLGIGEALASAPTKPRRSMLFVWHNAEEAGLLGAQYFTDNPSVDRGAIVAHLNMDMIGRGGAADIEDGGPGYIQMIGSRRLSTELGDLVETVNTDGNHGFTFDYQFDADGHPSQYYCRSDHYMYARYGIPVAFFSTGGHRDYHQVTDEAQYIDYEKMARVARFIQAVAEAVANLDHRVVVDGVRPNPQAPCQQ